MHTFIIIEYGAAYKLTIIATLSMYRKQTRHYFGGIFLSNHPRGHTHAFIHSLAHIAMPEFFTCEETR